MDTLFMTLPWIVAALGFFSYLSVAAWAAERRREREGFYKSEAIKRIVEMQGHAPESVVRSLLDTVNVWKEEKPMAQYQSKDYYQAQALQKIAESGGQSDAILVFLREERVNAARRTREGTRLGGIINVAVGMALIVFLQQIFPGKPVYLAGLIPTAVGVILVGYSFVIRVGV